MSESIRALRESARTKSGRRRGDEARRQGLTLDEAFDCGIYDYAYLQAIYDGYAFGLAKPNDL